jgi:hypothetical protein
LNFLDTRLKKDSVSKFVKIRPVGFELFHADRQKDMTKFIVAVSNFAKALIKSGGGGGRGEGVNRIYMPQNRDKWRAFLNTVIKLLV